VGAVPEGGQQAGPGGRASKDLGEGVNWLGAGIALAKAFNNHQTGHGPGEELAKNGEVEKGKLALSLFAVSQLDFYAQNPLWDGKEDVRGAAAWAIGILKLKPWVVHGGW